MYIHTYIHNTLTRCNTYSTYVRDYEYYIQYEYICASNKLITYVTIKITVNNTVRVLLVSMTNMYIVRLECSYQYDILHMSYLSPSKLVFFCDSIFDG